MLQRGCTVPPKKQLFVRLEVNFNCCNNEAKMFLPKYISSLFPTENNLFFKWGGDLGTPAELTYSFVSSGAFDLDEDYREDLGASADDFVFKNPLIKVILNNDIQQYSLNTNNLYQFSVNLDEVQ